MFSHKCYEKNLPISPCYGKQIRVSLITTSGPQASACLSLVLRAEPGLHQDRWESHPKTVKSSVFLDLAIRQTRSFFYWERNITITNSSVRSVIARMLWKVQTVILLASEIFNFNLGKSHYSKHWIQDLCCLRLCLTMDSGPGLILWLDISCSASLWWEHKYAHNPWLWK